MNGVAAFEQWQQPATSPADWAMAPLPSGLSSGGSLASQMEIPTSKTSPGLDASHTVEDSAILLQSRRIQRSTPAILRRDSDVAIQQSSVASTPSATEKCWLDGSLSP
ncbi:hypothetical protein RB195_014914 [Necator americanus]|uniref:Uncharacterized protein n=1 Tax=Necator americanus TaxID=51031 RepID=A0ABR1E287_NECAM